MTLDKIHKCVLEGDAPGTEANIKSALDEGIEAGKILNESLIAAMDEVGTRFENGEYYVPEMLIAARAMQAGLGLLKPQLVEAGIESAGKVVIGTVKGDLHDIGKNLVAMMLEGAGFEIIDLGTDVGPDQFIAAVQEHRPHIMGISALLTTTMQGMKSTIEVLEDAGVRDSVKIIVGGAPVTDDFAKEIGADGYAPDASRAVAVAKSLM
jgi:5-methyltetrahydrofolate--homocysteine methyltransferase